VPTFRGGIAPTHSASAGQIFSSFLVDKPSMRAMASSSYSSFCGCCALYNAKPRSFLEKKKHPKMSSEFVQGFLKNLFMTHYEISKRMKRQKNAMKEAIDTHHSCSLWIWFGTHPTRNSHRYSCWSSLPVFCNCGEDGSASKCVLFCLPILMCLQAFVSYIL
jgi:hypothetical protein